MNSIQNAHDGDEITSACIENRRLFTGARNGTIKVNLTFLKNDKEMLNGNGY